MSKTSTAIETVADCHYQDVDVEDTKRDLVSARISYVLYTSFSGLVYSVQLLQGRHFFYSRYDEDMNNPLLILTLLTIISLDINGPTNSM